MQTNDSLLNEWLEISLLRDLTEYKQMTDVQLDYRAIDLMSSVHQWSGRPVFNPRSNHTKNLKNGTWCHLA